MINIGPTAAGFVRDRLDVILEKLTARVQGIYGEELSLDPSTQDGQLLGIVAEAIDDCAQALEDVFNGRNPNGATGAALGYAARLNGLSRNTGSQSWANVTVTCTPGEVIPGTFQVQDVDTGTIYQLGSDYTPATSPVVLTFTALDYGTPQSAIGKISKIVTPVFGVSAVYNWLPSSLAEPYESDEAFRIRRAQSTAAPSRSMHETMLATLLALPNLPKVKIWENNESAQASAKGGDNALPPHSVTVVLSAGEASEVGRAIFNSISMGCATVGTLSTTVQDSANNGHLIRYNIATDAPIGITITYSERVNQGFGGTGGEETTKQAIVDWIAANQQIGQDVIWSMLFEPANTVKGIDGLPAIDIKSILVGRYGEAQYAVDLALGYKELASLTTANITMTEV